MLGLHWKVVMLDRAQQMLCLTYIKKLVMTHFMKIMNIWKFYLQCLAFSGYIKAMFLLLLDAVKQISGYMGMQPCERSDKVDGNKSSHTLLLAGVYRGGHDVLVRARLAKSEGVTMKITIRSDSLNACEVIAAAVG